MNNIIYRITAVVLGYAFGLFQTGYIYGKLHKVDIRDHGSGNAGTTNAMRVLGKKAGIITFLGDALKALFAGIVMRLLCAYAFNITDEAYVFLLVLYTGFGVILGHNFPFYMGFKGGKGIAASGGAVTALLDWKLFVLEIATFATVAIVSKYVSLASICMMTGFFVEIVLFGSLKLLPVQGHFIEIIIISFCISALAVIRHKGNIERLSNGTERKILQKKQ